MTVSALDADFGPRASVSRWRPDDDPEFSGRPFGLMVALVPIVIVLGIKPLFIFSTNMSGGSRNGHPKIAY